MLKRAKKFHHLCFPARAIFCLFANSFNLTLEKTLAGLGWQKILAYRNKFLKLFRDLSKDCRDPMMSSL